MVEISAKIRPSLIALNVGDEISFPIEKLKVYELRHPNWAPS